MGSKFVVESKVRKYIRSKGCRASKDMFRALDYQAQLFLDRATERARADQQRGTVCPTDL